MSQRPVTAPATQTPGPRAALVLMSAVRLLTSLAAIGLILAACLAPAGLPVPTEAPVVVTATPYSIAPTAAAVVTPMPTQRPLATAAPTTALATIPADTPPPPTAQPRASATPPAPTAAPPTEPPARLGSAPTGPTQEARVVRVVDGDTIRVAFGGQEFPVRYIGIDTPETVHPSQPVEWMGREASAANSELVEGRTVVLEKDVSETDQYDRLLRYVWVVDGGAWLLVNRELVRRGFAQVSTYPPDVKYTDLFLQAQERARDRVRGLWGAPPADEEPPPEENSGGSGGGGGGGRGGSCDPAYPDVCIPASPPDLDCGDIPHRRFAVLPPDPHRFDGEGDGIGCESG